MCCSQQPVTPTSNCPIWLIAAAATIHHASQLPPTCKQQEQGAHQPVAWSAGQAALQHCHCRSLPLQDSQPAKPPLQHPAPACPLPQNTPAASLRCLPSRPAPPAAAAGRQAPPAPQRLRPGSGRKQQGRARYVGFRWQGRGNCVAGQVPGAQPMTPPLICTCRCHPSTRPPASARGNVLLGFCTSPARQETLSQ